MDGTTNDVKGQKSNKSDTHVSKYRKARDYRTYSSVYKVRPVTGPIATSL